MKKLTGIQVVALCFCLTVLVLFVATRELSLLPGESRVGAISGVVDRCRIIRPQSGMYGFDYRMAVEVKLRHTSIGPFFWQYSGEREETKTYVREYKKICEGNLSVEIKYVVKRRLIKPNLRSYDITSISVREI